MPSTTEPGTCSICGAARRVVFDKTLLGRHLVEYFLCESCGLLQTESPHWLAESYEVALAAADTGLLARNLRFAPRIGMVLTDLHGPQARFVDLAGGSGLLVRLLRDAGLDFFWEDKYSDNLFARGFEAEGSFAAASAVEVFEHLEDPLAFVSDAFACWGLRSLIFTTELWSGPDPDPEWWYLSPSTGQHISFFQHRTLAAMADRLDLGFASHRGVHLFTKEAVSDRRFRLLTSRAAKALWPIRSRGLESKTWADHLSVIDRYQ